MRFDFNKPSKYDRYIYDPIGEPAALCMLFNELGGGIIRNYGSAGGVGTLQGVTAGQQPWSNGGLSFDGADDFVSVAHKPIFNASVFTIEMLVTITAFKDFGILLMKGGSVNASPFSIWSYSGGNITARIGSGTAAIGANAGNNPALLGKSRHLMFVADGSNISLFVQGEVAASTPQTIVSATNTTAIEIGGYTGQPTRSVNGIIHKFGYYPGIFLSPAEIQQRVATPYMDFRQVKEVIYSIPSNIVYQPQQIIDGAPFGGLLL